MEYRPDRSLSAPSATVGVDDHQLRQALARTPRERFERGVRLAKVSAWLRRAKHIPPTRRS